jgi:hypothetical protein
MSITTIAHQAQGMRGGEVIAKLAEDAYFMRVDSRVTQVPPIRNCQQDNEATSRSVDIGRNRTRGELPANPNRTRASAGGPSHGSNNAGGTGANCEIIPHRDPGSGGSDGGSSNHGAGRRAGAEATTAGEARRIAMPPALHAAALMPTRKSKNYDARSPPRQATTVASPPSPRGFAIYFFRRNSNLWGSPSTTRSRIQCSGQMLRPLHRERWWQ